MSDFADSAFYAIKLGLPVFPYHPGSKEPAVNAWPRAASTDPSTVLRWAERHPKANVGVLPRESIVLDIDGDEGRRTLEGLELPPTLEVTARRGPHYYFSGKLPESAPQYLGPELELRGGARPMLFPHSTFEGHVYDFDGEERIAQAPDALLALIRSKTVKSDKQWRLGQPIYRGTRNATLTRIAGALYRDGFSGAEAIEAALMAANRERCRPPLPAKEVAAIAASAARTFKTPPPWLATPLEVARWCADEQLSAPAVAVLRCLADHANQDGECWPALETIQTETRIGRNRVRRALDELQEAGRLSRERRPRASSLYRLYPYNTGTSCTPGSTTSRRQA